MPSSIETGQALPLIGHLYDHTGAAFKQSFKLLNTPDLSLALNGQGASALTIELEAPLSGGNVAPAMGDILTLTEDGGDGSVVFKGIVEDFPDSRGNTNAHEILANPVGVQLGDTPFNTTYASATDTGQIARDIVSACPNLSSDATSIPLSGVTAIFDFNGQSYTCLTALDELRKMSGVNFYYWPEPTGRVWFKAANTAAPATHTIAIAPQTSARKYTAPVAKRKNIVTGYGAVLANASAPITATYDTSAGSPLGKRELVPALSYSQLTDQTTLQNIVNTVGSALDRQIVTVELDIENYATRIQPGDTLRYFEEAVNERLESAVGSGAMSPTYVVLSARANGATQSVVASDVAIQLSDLQYLIDSMIARASVAVTKSIQAGSVQTITPGMVGTSVPSTPAAPTVTTAIERNAQADNGDATVSWLANPGGDYVNNYRVRWRQGSGPYGYVDSAGGNLSLTIHGLTPGASYGFSVAAVNSIGNVSAWSTETTHVIAVDVTAPATPTGLAAITTPRGALVSWNGNTEADLQGYELQVSIGGGAYVAVTPGATLVTSFAYVAPSGTAQGTSLTFEVRALDWSGNASAWSAASAAVNTDGIVFDELLAGNLKVFGTLTSGGVQTAASGARIVLDGTSLRIYDGTSANYGAPSGAGITAELGNDGSAFFQGTVSASKVYGGTIATSANIGATGSGAGYKLSGQFLDFFTVGTTAEGTRYWFAPDNSTPFALAGQLAAGLTTFARGAADSDSEAITTTGGPVLASVLAMATFKPSGTIARVGSLGAFTVTNGGSITPAFGQATTAGHLLTAWVAANAATPPSITTAAAGWTKALAANGTNAEVDIWYKANCGAGETPPTFTATLQAPSAADSLTETITDSGGGAQTANLANMVAASFSPAGGGTPISLVSAGPFTIGTGAGASPSFGQPTGSGNLLVAWVSGDTGTTGGGTANLGSTANASTGTYDGNTPSGGTNVLIMGPYTMPQHGQFTSLTVNMAGQSGTITGYAVLWDGSGNLVTYASFSAGAGTYNSYHTVGITTTDAPAGSSWYFGIYWAKTDAAFWGVNTGGSNFKFKNGQNGIPAVGGYSNCSGFPNCGSVTAYGTYNIVSPGTDITTTATGWTKAVQAKNGNAETQLWYKPNSASSEAAPVFTSSFGVKTMYAQLAEFSGVATITPLDKTGTFLQGAASTSMTVAGSAIDTQSGDLVLTASRWEFASAATASFADTLNNATPTSAGNSGGSSEADHANFVYGVVPVPAMHAQLAEWSGVVTASPLDQTGSTAQATSATDITATAAAIDAAAGNLILTAGRWLLTSNATATWADAYNNASSQNAGNSGASSLSQHSNFEYGIVSGSTTGEDLQLTNFVGLEAITTASVLGRGLLSTQYSTDTFGGSFVGRKARGTQSSPTAIANGDQIGAFNAQAYDGANWFVTGRATFDVDGSVTSGHIPTDFNIRLNPGTGEFLAMSFKGDGSGMVGTWTKYRARVYQTGTAQGIQSVVATIAFNTVDYDPNGNFNTSTHLYTAPLTGYYRVSATVMVNQGGVGGTDRLRAWIAKNGAETCEGSEVISGGPSSFPASVVSDIVHLTAGDTLGVGCFFNAGAGSVLYNANAASRFTVEYAGS